jgi:hypothetical protein
MYVSDGMNALLMLCYTQPTSTSSVQNTNLNYIQPTINQQSIDPTLVTYYQPPRAPPPLFIMHLIIIIVIIIILIIISFPQLINELIITSLSPFLHPTLHDYIN